MPRTMLAGVALVFAAATAVGAEPLEDWLGTWSNPSSSGLVGVDIALEGGALRITGRGACTPNPCDWGETAAYAHAPSAAVDPADDTASILATWNHGFSEATLVLGRAGGGALSAQLLTRFTDGSGRSDYVSTTTLTRSAVLSPGGLVATLAIPRADEDCIGFDPESVQAREIDGRWKVVSGSMYMLDAGPERDEMRQAAYVIRHYGLTQQCFVGRPDPSLEYWLTPAGAASGRARSEDCIGIDPTALSVRDSGSHWTVLDGPSHAAFSAPSREEAERIVEIVERYGFTQSCFVGRPDPSMQYLRK